jgi:hypothetical protein
MSKSPNPTKKPESNRPRRNTTPQFTPIAKIKAIAAKHPKATQGELAKLCDISKQAMSSMLKRHNLTLGTLQTYKDKRADVYANIEAEILSSIDIECIDKSSLLQRVTAAGILKTHERLERGQVTSQLSVIFSLVRDACSATPHSQPVEVKAVSDTISHTIEDYEPN